MVLLRKKNNIVNKMQVATLFNYIWAEGEIKMNICLYGASSKELDKKYISAAEELGRIIAERGHSLVYGGGAHGMMGAAARGVKSAGGTVIGVAPRFFNVDGVLYDECDEFIYTETMRERKQIMEERSDAFVAVPGGIGTFEEFFEILTLKQLGRHDKPIALYNTFGYYDCLENMLKKAVRDKFMTEGCSMLYRACASAEEILDYFENYKSEKVDLSTFKNIWK